MIADSIFRPLGCPVWLRPAVFLGRMMRLQPKLVGLITVVMALLGFVEGLGLSLLLPLLSLIGVETTSHASGPVRVIERAFAVAGLPLTLPVILFVFFGAGMLQILLHGAQQYLIVRCGEDLTISLRRRLFDAASRAAWPVLAAGRGAHLVNAVVSEAGRVGTIHGNTVTAFGLIFNFLFYLGLAAWLSWPFTLLTATAAVISMVGLRGLYRSSRRFGIHTSSASNRMQEVLNEHVAGAKLIRVLGADGWSRATFAAVVTSMAAYLRRNKCNTILVKMSVDPFGLVIVVIMVYLSVAVVRLPAAELLLFLLIFYRTMPRLVTLQEMLQRVVGVLPSYEAVAETLKELGQAREPRGGRPFPGLRAAVELREVEVRRGGRTVLDGVSLVIPARTTVVLVGRSGGGKTTLLDVLAGLVPPDAGRVLVDGVPLDELDLTAFRRRIGVVPQDSVFFHDTIGANLRVAAPEAGEAEIWAALAAAHAEDFVRASAQGLDTLMGDQGLRLSGGQRQRLALARALLRKPDLLLLDEPSSALDGESEAAIRATLGTLRRTVTIVVVSHRPTMLTDADAVYRLEGGRLEVSAGAAGPYAGALRVE